MTTHIPSPLAQPPRSAALSTEALAALLVAAAILFNAALALVNAQGVSMTRSGVAPVEVAIVALTVLVAVRAAVRPMVPWIGMIWFLISVFLCLWLLRQTADVKHLRDVLLIPIFIMLGMAAHRADVVRLFASLQAIVLGVMIFEAVLPVTYGEVFKVASYYVNTRDFIQEGFWHAESNLFLSAFRPDERFLFGFLGIHRLSSVFLEPVSLGNWCIVITLFTMSFLHQMSRPMIMFFFASNVAILIGCDGRLALVSCALIVLGAPLFLRLPRGVHVLYLPLLVALALATVIAFDMRKLADDFIGRVAFSMNLLARFELSALLGIDRTFLANTADSGVGYVILTQSIVGAGILWAAISMLMPQSGRPQILFSHGLSVYIALNLMVSYSLFSVKTAAPLWFLYGLLAARAALVMNRVVAPTGARSLASAAAQTHGAGPEPRPAT